MRLEMRLVSHLSSRTIFLNIVPTAVIQPPGSPSLVTPEKTTPSPHVPFKKLARSEKEPRPAEVKEHRQRAEP